MKRYRERTPDQARLIGERGASELDFAALFGRSAPVRLEIGFGHGEFIAQMAAAHPDEDFIGVDIHPLRATKTAHRSNKEGAANVRLFTSSAETFVATQIPTASVHRVYILFPDPWPKLGHRRRRLMQRAFLAEIARVLAPGGRLIIASDTHNYVMQALSNLSTLPGMFRNLYLPAGYRIDIPTRFPTLFERHKKAEGCSIGYLLMERRADS